MFSNANSKIAMLIANSNANSKIAMLSLKQAHYNNIILTCSPFWFCHNPSVRYAVNSNTVFYSIFLMSMKELKTMGKTKLSLDDIEEILRPFICIRGAEKV